MSCADARTRARWIMTLLLAAALGLSEGPIAVAGGSLGSPSLAQATGIRPADRSRSGAPSSASRGLRSASPPPPARRWSGWSSPGATRASLADIGPGTFLGTAARAQPDGSFRALEVHIFPESMRGAGEGHRPMDAPGTTMTNASVDALVQRADGPLLTLKHKDGVTQVLVPPDAPIVRFGPGDASLLVPGASIVVSRAVRAADGTVSASRLTVGVDGTRLPM